MMATQCPTEERLRAFGLGTLSLHDSDDLFDHVKTCPACQAELETMHSCDDSLVEQLRSPDSYAEFHAEPDCQVAVARALSVLARVGDTPDDAASTNMPPRLGEYEIVRRLGRGGMGSVYLGRHTKLGREVAIKVLAHHRMSDERVVERFESEMKAIGRLSHPNIVSAYDAREVDGLVVLITEFIDGFDLGALLKRTGPLSISNACSIILQTAVALEYTHQQGFVHRDVKPGNIMVSREGHVKLLDLGLARLQLDEQRADITGTGQAIGTADFIAPEQVTDGRSVDARADIYSLGCTFYKLLTGMAPFESDQHPTAFAKMTAHVSKPAPSLATLVPSVSPKLVRLVDAMMAKSPLKRPQHMHEIVSIVREFAQGADLASVVQQAEHQQPDAGRIHAADDASRSRPVHRPWYARRVPITWLIATGFVSAGLGFLLGILITIKQPDGTVVQHRVPDQSEVTISQDDGSTTPPMRTPSLPEQTPGRISRWEPRSAVPSRTPDLRGQTPSTTPRSRRTPAVATEASGTTATAGEAIGLRPGVESTRVAQAIDDMPLFFGVVASRADQGYWIDATEAIPLGLVPSRSENGIAQILIDDDPANQIAWQDLIGQLSANVDQTGVSLVFSQSLAQRMKALTESNVGRHLAIVLNGKLVASPKIVSPIGSSAVLSGLKDDEVQFLMQALNGLVTAAPAAGASSASAPTFRTRTGARTPAIPGNLNDTRLDNLKRLALALLNYESTHQSLPASANKARERQRLPHPYSWRVALLPFLGPDEAKLYSEYNFQEPWDSEANRMVLEKMPDIYRSPRAGNGQPRSETNYLGFVGQGAFGESEGKALRDFTDGTSNSVLLVETTKTVPWTKPDDLPFRSADDAAGLAGPDGLIHWVMADGSARTLESGAHSLAEIAAYITIAGGEPIPPIVAQ